MYFFLFSIVLSQIRSDAISIISEEKRKKRICVWLATMMDHITHHIYVEWTLWEPRNVAEWRVANEAVKMKEKILERFVVSLLTIYALKFGQNGSICLSMMVEEMSWITSPKWQNFIHFSWLITWLFPPIWALEKLFSFVLRSIFHHLIHFWLPNAHVISDI